MPDTVKFSRLRRVFLVMAMLLAPASAGRVDAQRAAHEELQLFSAALNQIRLNYVDSVGYTQMVRAAVDGALKALDPHSYFAERPTWERLQALERRELATPGLHLEDVGDDIAVLAVVDNSPAERAGLLPGDRVLTVAGQPVAGLAARDVELLLTGPDGSKVEVSVLRGAGAALPDTIRVQPKRRMPEQRSVRTALMVQAGVGYVRLDQFGAGATREVRSALQDLKKKGMQRAVLDLRGNPGGLVTEAADLAGEFLARGTLVFRTAGRKRDANSEYRTTRDPTFPTLPLVVLIDAGSASAAEAVAAALQDHDRALLAGRRSFGKALVQTGFPLASGDMLWLTIARVVSPSGRIIQRPHHGKTTEAYHAQAGTKGAEDSLPLYHTAKGRPVRGGGGVNPDHIFPAPLALPGWWADAKEAGDDLAVADSVAHTLGADARSREQWSADAARWEAVLLPPLRARVTRRLSNEAPLTEAQAAEISRRLAYRVSEVRWGTEAAELLRLQTDTDVTSALRLGQ